MQGAISPARNATEKLSARWWAGFLLAAVLILAALQVWNRNSLWEPSEGVYAYTANALLHGASLYRDLAVAQLPPLFYFGTGVLAIHDSLGALRVALALVLLAGSGLTAAAIWRLTGNKLAAAIGGLAALLTPWAVREHTVLMPETFAGPLLMGAALLSTRRHTSAAGGAVAALCVSFKLPFLLPALALGLVARRRERYFVGAGLTLVLLGVLFAALNGVGPLEDMIRAQLQSGHTDLTNLVYLGAQAAWNLAPLLALSCLAYLFRDQARDPRLLRALGVLAVANALLVLTLFKNGTYLAVVLPAEAPAVALAAAGTTWLFAHNASRALSIAALVACLLLVAQVGSLLVAPDSPGAFGEPLRPKGHTRDMSPSEVNRNVAQARRCPRGEPYSGEPFIAFIAGRRVPGNQPDGFIIRVARVERPKLEAARRDHPSCP